MNTYTHTLIYTHHILYIYLYKPYRLHEHKKEKGADEEEEKKELLRTKRRNKF